MSSNGGSGRRWAGVSGPLTTVFLAVVLAACGGASTASRRTSNTGSATTPGSGVSASSGSTSAVAGTGSGSAQAVNLPLTDAVRAQLVAAGAALHSLPTSDYTGLVPGTTYYARDLSTGDYWAAAGLVPKAGSYDAGVRNQDEGAYMILARSAGGAWHGWETGLTGGPRGPCRVTVPPAVLTVWGWPPATCYPPTAGQSATASSSGSASTATPCESSQIKARLVGTPSGQSQYVLALDLTNGGSTACTMTGFPGFELVGPMSDGSTTYDPARQEVSYQAVTVGPGDTAHASLYVLPGPDECDNGTAWVPTSATVTLPNTTRSFSVEWPGGSVDNCQGGATHPGTYVGPVQSGA